MRFQDNRVRKFGPHEHIVRMGADWLLMANFATHVNPNGRSCLLSTNDLISGAGSMSRRNGITDADAYCTVTVKSTVATVLVLDESAPVTVKV